MQTNHATNYENKIVKIKSTFLASAVALAVLAGGLLSASSSRAATHVWVGAGITGNWSLPANWQANNPPVAGEAPPVIIYFAAAAARLNSTNNLANLVLDSVYFQGDNFTVEGAGAGANLTFRDGGNGLSFGGTGKNNTLGGTLNITLTNSVPFYLYYDLTINSRLVGPGGFTLDANSGSGVLTLNGVQDNLFAGSVNVINGYLQLQNGYPFFDIWISSIAVPNALTVGGTNMDHRPRRFEHSLHGAGKYQSRHGDLDQHRQCHRSGGRQFAICRYQRAEFQAALLSLLESVRQRNFRFRILYF